MNENIWPAMKMILDSIATIFIPFVAWMFYTIFQHGKKLAMLEQKVNDSINMRLDNLENKFDNLDEKLDFVKDSIIDNKIQIQENMNQKFGTLLVEIKKGNKQ
jgi:hypothetical protein